jgi:hypothetical protein
MSWILVISWCHGFYIIFACQIQANNVFVSMEENKNLELRIPLFWDMTTHQWAMEFQCFKDTAFP